MTTEELNNIEKELTEKGYRRVNNEFINLRNAYYWYKPFGDSPCEEDRCIYQVFFLVYDFRPFQYREPNLKPFGCQAMVMYSRSTEERVDISLGHGVKDVNMIENFAQSFAEWYGPRYEDDFFYAYQKDKDE